MNLTIIKGNGLMAGKTKTAYALSTELRNASFIREHTLVDIKYYLKQKNPLNLIIEQAEFKKDVIDYLKSIADEIRIINIKRVK